MNIVKNETASGKNYPANLGKTPVRLGQRLMRERQRRPRDVLFI